MKNTPLLIALSLAVLNSAAAQTQTRTRRSVDGQLFSRTESPSVRSRVVGTGRVANHAQKPRSKSQNPIRQGGVPPWGDTAIAKTSDPQKSISTPSEWSVTSSLPQNLVSRPGPKLVQKTAMVTEVLPKPQIVPVRAVPSDATASLPGPTMAVAYRVGVGDVLDIRLVDLPTRESTLFTVLKDGVIEYPLVGTPVTVDRLTTDEIASLLSKEIKVINRARVTVSVRDYASHGVVITGLVDNPGRKILRRETMPLYTVLAEALPRAEASVVTITRVNGKNESVSLADGQAMSILVLPGDAIKVSASPAAPKQFLYIGGDVASPGEKEFRDGITLTQALLAAGGSSRNMKNSVRVARRNATGFLVTTKYDLHSIAQGKTPDPLLEAGDRIEVTRGVW